MRKNRIMIWELLLIVMILLCGCGKRASSEAVVPADIVIHIEPETEPIVIEVEPDWRAGSCCSREPPSFGYYDEQ